ncbi:HIV Tat-specific factor 1 [Anopheles aquasalis]|uniref:HIV Tat-specific factor 1 n=1 Tax=Anopheles aquasalis TaxID=42839 RepID=UPI00215AD34A|nr:HIV Tat-specific factor 1 [Anopheles aquasalis]
MSSAESEGSESNVSVTMSSVEAAASAMLTDSENANNENRVIEMASGNPVTEETEPPTAPISEAADESEPVPKAEHSPPVEPKQTSPEDSSKSQDQRDQYAEHVTYNEAGEAIYTDPATKFQYRWSTDKNEWIPATGGAGKTDTAAENPFENEHYRWCHETNKWLPKETPTETEHYRWDASSGKWIPKQPVAQTPAETPESDDRQYGYEDGVHTYKDKDGAVFFWDEERKAWFPKIDDDFMAIYQLNYGFIDNTSGTAKPSEPERSGPAATAARTIKSDEQSKETELEEEGAGGQGKSKKRKAPPEPPKWFDLAPEQNTKVYVSNLPTDISEEEFGAVMSKCGMVMKDPKANKLKLKLYRDADGKPKGDGLCHYIKVESVELALSILDNYDVRGHKIKVQRAEFQMRGEYNPSLKPKMRKKEKERLKKMQESLFDWRPEKMRGERSKHERIVIIKNLFEPALFDREVHLLLEYQNDLREECGKCGSVRRVLLYDRHPEGVAQVTMGDPEEADLVVQLMNGRFFGQRKLSAAIWDGRTKYRIAETDADIDKRRGNWEEFLEADEQDKDAPKESLSIDSEKSDSRETMREEQKGDSKDGDKEMNKLDKKVEPESEACETPEMKSEHEPPVRSDDDDQPALPTEEDKEEVKESIRESEQRNGSSSSSSSDDDVDE